MQRLNDSSSSPDVPSSLQTDSSYFGNGGASLQAKEKLLVILGVGGLAVVICIIVIVGVVIWKKVVLRSRKPVIPYRTSKDSEEKSSMLDVETSQKSSTLVHMHRKSSSSSIRSFLFSLREGCSMKGRRREKRWRERELKDRPNCYVSTGGKVLCNETIQTENGQYSTSFFILCIIIWSFKKPLHGIARYETPVGLVPGKICSLY